MIAIDDVQDQGVGEASRPLPEGWTWVRLGDVCEIVIGRTPRRDNPAYWNGKLPWVMISDLNDGVITETLEQITELGAKESRSRLLEAGTLLFSFKLTIGKMAIAGFDLYTNEAIAGLIPRHDSDIHRDYLKFALRFIDARTMSSHAVKGKTLNQDSLHAIRIPLPPRPEQQRIAAMLTEQMAAVERARAAAEAQLAAARELPAAYLREAFDSPAARSWPKPQLGDVLQLRKEVVHPRDNPVGPATFVGLEHIAPVTGDRIGSVDVEMSQLTGRKPRFYKGDIVYGYLRPYLNKVWLAEFDGLCSVDQYVYAVDPNKARPEFVAWFMRSPVYLSRAPIDTTPGQLPRIRTDEVASVVINLPDLNEQQRIVSMVDRQMTSISNMCEALETQLGTINGLPAVLLRQAFSGAL